MSRLLPESFQPRLGLSSIHLTEDNSESKLPEDSRLQPIDASVEAQLRAMLQADTFDSMILEAVRPNVFDQAVLAPSRFHRLREEVSQRLASLEATASDPKQIAELQAASKLLRTRAGEHELGESLRYALLKG